MWTINVVRSTTAVTPTSRRISQLLYQMNATAAAGHHKPYLLGRIWRTGFPCASVPERVSSSLLMLHLDTSSSLLRYGWDLGMTHPVEDVQTEDDGMEEKLKRYPEDFIVKPRPSRLFG